MQRLELEVCLACFLECHATLMKSLFDYIERFEADIIPRLASCAMCVQVPFLTGMNSINEIRTMFAAEVNCSITSAPFF
jgi:hypothetical protein